MTDRIEIIGIEGFGYHGVFDHEKENGQIFKVDVTLDLDLSKASQSDDLSDTVDYGAISEVVESHITGAPYSLIEKLAGTIASQIISRFPVIQKVSVTVHKPQAPITVKFADVAVTVIRFR